jgi:SAM-dependent methyltransferase
LPTSKKDRASGVIASEEGVKLLFYHYYASRKKHPLGIWVHRLHAKQLGELVGRYLTKPVSIVEIGPGDGYFGEVCMHSGFSYRAIEANDELAKSLGEKGLHVLTASVPPIPVDARCIDICCMFHVMEHMADVTRVAELIEETKRILVPGGFLALACPNYDNWGRDFYEDYTHNYITTPRRVNQLL